MDFFFSCCKTANNDSRYEVDKSKNYKRPDVSSFDSDSDGDEGEMIDFNQKVKKQQQQKKTRNSVSAEVFGQFNKKNAYVPKVINKSEDQKRRIRERLDQSFMFKMLEESDKKIVVDAMEEKRYSKGDIVIKQGNDGDMLFLVEQGQLRCTKRFDQNSRTDTFLLNYHPGMSFGEYFWSSNP